MPNLDAPFYPALDRLAAELGVPADWVLVLLYLESRLEPSARNSLGYVGLNQMSSANLARLGIAPDDYRTWPASVQLRRVVGPFLKGQVAWLGEIPRSAGVLYGLNFYPASLKSRGTRPDSILVDASAPTDSERRAYAANKGLDVDKDGRITVEDLDTFLEALQKQSAYRAARANLSSPPAPPAGPPATSATSAVLKPLVGAAAIIGLGWLVSEQIRHHATHARRPAVGR